MPDDGYRDFIISGNDHGPQNTLFHVRAVASFLARKAKPRSQKDLLEESPREGGDPRHPHTAMAVECLSIATPGGETQGPPSSRYPNPPGTRSKAPGSAGVLNKTRT